MTWRLSRTEQVAGGWGGQYPQAAGHPSGAMVGAGDHREERVREAAGVPGGRARRRKPPGQGAAGVGGTPAECRCPETLFRACLPAGASTDVPEGGRLSRHKGLAGAEAAVLSGFGFLGPKPAKRGRPLKLDLWSPQPLSHDGLRPSQVSGVSQPSFLPAALPGGAVRGKTQEPRGW